jgi:HD superfamily phosphohydrolase
MTTSNSLSSLYFPYKRILVFPDRILRATMLEMAMIDTRIMQRLRNTRQLGNSQVSYPTADHSRFSHSLGVLYWSAKILSSLNDNHNSNINKPILAGLDDTVRAYLKKKISSVDRRIFEENFFLGVSWFEQLVRLYALLHDISHIPFGHTLEDQAGILERHDDDLDRLNFVFDQLKSEVYESYHFDEIEFGETLSQIASEYIDLIKDMFVVGNITSLPHTNDHHRKDWIEVWNKIDEDMHKPLILTYDIVSNTICADLMDYTLRDTLFSSMPKTFDRALLIYMKIVNHKTIIYLPDQIDKDTFRLGVTISRKKIRHDIITAILDLLRIRYDLTEKVYYHHTKVITDVMLEKVIRSLPTKDNLKGYSEEEVKELQFTWEQIYTDYLGDEGFLYLLEKKVKGTPKLANSLKILNKIFSRYLYKAVFRINRNTSLGIIGKKNLDRCKKPEDRSKLEDEIITELRGKNKIANFADGDIIICYPPQKMQMKVAKALIEWSDGQIFTFEELPMETNYSNEVGLLTERYKTLWSMTIFINPQKIEYIRLVESICETKFDIQNESILKNYLKERFKVYYESQDTMTEIKHRVLSIEAAEIKAKRAKGGKYEPSSSVEMTEHAYETTIKERRDQKKDRRGKTKLNPPNDDNQKEIEY